MIRINLLPPEITEKRRTENRLAFVLLGFVLAAAFLGLFFAVMVMQVDKERENVESLNQELLGLQAQAEQLKIFADKETDLGARADLVDKTLEGRVDWSRLCEEVSLVLPTDVWLTDITGGEQDGMTLIGSAIDLPDDVPDAGHKTMARLLVRLADLEQLYNVWLSDSKKIDPDPAFEEQWLEFTVTASVKPADSAPVPPEQSSQ